MNNVIAVSAVLDSPSALTQEQGEKIYKIISDSIDAKKEIVLDFSGIESMISPFLNIAVGKLYGAYSSAAINSYLKFYNFPESKLSTLKVVIANAKKFYENKEDYASTVKDVIG